VPCATCTAFEPTSEGRATSHDGGRDEFLSDVAAGRPILIDVAEQAGVSRQTVSRVLNGSPQVAAKTRRQVLASMRVLGYRRNEVASSLRTGRTGTIAMLLSNVMTPFFAAELRGVQDVVERQGCRVLSCNTDEDFNKEQHYLQVLLEQRVDGALVIAVGDDSEPLLRDFARHGAPVVVLNRLAPRIDSVSIDHP
jgi:LacI family transcriptional regulator